MKEYDNTALFYDLFYSNKSYEKEIDFLKSIIKNKKTILDVGCGTGIHMSLLENDIYIVDGLDISLSMLDIAKKRTIGNLYNANLLNYKIDKKYDAIISMFAVFNYLNNYDEFEKGILNSIKHLNKNGILIIDLHNGRNSGSKETKVNNNKRIMTWNYDEKKSKEYTTTNYLIGDNNYEENHVFLIYDIAEIKKILNNNNLNYKLYENYTYNKATNSSKNIEIVIYI